MYVDSKWVYGGVFQGNGDFSIIYTYKPIDKFVVYSDTVGQYTGFDDKNGKKIFQGDIVRYPNGYGYIAWAETHGAFMCVEENGEYWEWFDNMYDIEVIGNIHDNPELLEQVK